MFGIGAWVQVASRVPGRSPSQCLHRWHYAIALGKQKGKFTTEEDELLLKGIQELGRGKWKEISRLFLPGRTDAQIRERFENVLNPDINQEPWALDELNRLFNYVENYGTKWSFIAKQFQNRTDEQCKREYLKLKRKEKKMMKFELKEKLSREKLNSGSLRKRGRPRQKETPKKVKAT